MAVAVAGGGHRVDREDLAFAGPQHGHQQAPGGLDRDRDRGVFGVAVLGEQVQQQLIAGSIIGDAACSSWCPARHLPHPAPSR